MAPLTVPSTPHPRAMTQALRGEQALRSWYMAAFQLPYLPEALLGARFRNALRGSGLPEEDLERYAARLASPQALAGPINWYRAVPLSRIRARRVTVPTTYVWGSGDFALGRRAAELTADYVRGPYEFVELDAGHWLAGDPGHRQPDPGQVLTGRAGGPLCDRGERAGSGQDRGDRGGEDPGQPVADPARVARVGHRRQQAQRLAGAVRVSNSGGDR